MDSPRITPEPDGSEREAILEALAADETETASVSPWADALLPARGEEAAGRNP